MDDCMVCKAKLSEGEFHIGDCPMPHIQALWLRIEVLEDHIDGCEGSLVIEGMMTNDERLRPVTWTPGRYRVSG